MEGSGDDVEESVAWAGMLEPILAMVLDHLTAREVLDCGQVCRHWNAASRDNLLWKRLFRRNFKVKAEDQSSEVDWRGEYRRLVDRVPSVEAQVLEGHTDEVLHVSFSHDGTQIASCSKDNRLTVWNHDVGKGDLFSPHYARRMDSFLWRHTWAAQYSPADTKLMVAGVTSTIGGEVAIFRTGRGADERYVFLCRVVNDPYDVLGCWVTDRYFLSGTFSTNFSAQLEVLIWLCDTPEQPDAPAASGGQHGPNVPQLVGAHGDNLLQLHAAMGDQHVIPAYQQQPQAAVNLENSDLDQPPPPLNLTCYKGIAFKFRSMGGSIYMRYLQSHSRSKYRNRQVKVAQEQDPILVDAADWSKSQQEEEEDEGEDEDDQPLQHNHFHPFNQPGNEPWAGIEHVDGLNPECERQLSERDICVVFLCGDKTSVPHQLGFQRLRPSELERGGAGGAAPRTLRSPEKVIDFRGHVIGMALSPDERRLFVNVRAWPENAVPSPDQAPPISTAIDMHEVDLETLELTGRIFTGHQGFTPTETAFYLYSDVSDDFVTSGSESSRGCIWDRTHGSLVARLPHEACVNSVAISPVDQEMCVTASDDNKMKVWKSKRKMRATKEEGSSSRQQKTTATIRATTKKMAK